MATDVHLHFEPFLHCLVYYQSEFVPPRLRGVAPSQEHVGPFLPPTTFFVEFQVSLWPSQPAVLVGPFVTPFFVDFEARVPMTWTKCFQFPPHLNDVTDLPVQVSVIHYVGLCRLHSLPSSRVSWEAKPLLVFSHAVFC